MADTWGLAKKATSIAVRVLNANGSGSTAYVKTMWYYQNIAFIFPLSFFLTLLFTVAQTHNSGVIAGVNWVANQNTSGKKSVAKYVTLTSKILNVLY